MSKRAYVWRIGRKVPHHVYCQRGEWPSDDDKWVGSFPDPEDAELAVACVNTIEAMRSAGVTAAHVSAAVIRARHMPAETAPDGRSTAAGG